METQRSRSLAAMTERARGRTSDSPGGGLVSYGENKAPCCGRALTHASGRIMRVSSQRSMMGLRALKGQRGGVIITPHTLISERRNGVPGHEMKHPEITQFDVMSLPENGVAYPDVQGAL